MTENEKYTLLDDDTVERNGVVLKRVKALVDFRAPTTYADPSAKIVQAGDLGGYIESEQNLQKTGNAWVGNGVFVWGGARVCDNGFARTENGGIVEIYDTAVVGGTAEVVGIPVFNGEIEDKTTIINGNAVVAGKVTIMGANKLGNNVGLDGYLSFVGSYDLKDVRLSGRSKTNGEIITRARWLPENTHWHNWAICTHTPNSDLVLLKNKGASNNFYNVNAAWQLQGNEEERKEDFIGQVEQSFCACILAVGSVEDVPAFKETTHSQNYFLAAIPEYWQPKPTRLGKLWGAIEWQRETMGNIDDVYALETPHTAVLGVCSHCAEPIADELEYPEYTRKPDGFVCPHCNTSHERTWDNWLANIRKRDMALGANGYADMEEKYLAAFEQWQNAPTPENENALVSLFKAQGLSEIYLHDETSPAAERSAAIRHGFYIWALKKNAQYVEYQAA